MKQLTVIILLLLPALGIGQTIQVKGTGRQSVLPDMGTIDITVSSRDMDYNRAVSTLNERTEQLYQALEKSGYERDEIKTINFMVRPNRVYGPRGTYDSGYIGVQSVIAEFEYTKDEVGKLIRTIRDSNTGVEFSFRFSLSDKKRNEVQSELIRLAVEDATHSAAVLARTTGRKLGSIREIAYGQPQGRVYFQEGSARMMSMEKSDADPGFTINEVELTDEVVITWSLK